MPDELEGPVVGWRAWRLRDDRLWALAFAGAEWSPGWNTAECMLQRTEAWQAMHKAPGSGCHCGFNAWHEPRFMEELGGGSLAFGAVLGQGDVEVHIDGWRASEARVLTLVARHGDDLAKVVRVARHYEVPLLDRHAARVIAEEYATVPQELRPAVPPAPDRRTRRMLLQDTRRRLAGIAQARNAQGGFTNHVKGD